MVRSDNGTTVVAGKLWLRVAEVVLSLRALHIPGLENRGADLMLPYQASGRFTRRW